ncbi:MAG: DUF4397 domain-containing protein [Nocardioidaceae bacterium]
MNRRCALAGATAAAALTVTALALPTQASAADAAGGGGTAKVNVIHGIPGAKVKVCLDGKPAIRGFTYGEKVIGAAIPAGKHRVRVVAASRSCHAPAILRDRYRLQAGKNYTLVAAVKPSGTPRLKAYGNRVNPVDKGTARLVVRHTAKAPAVNVWAGKSKLIGGRSFTWGESRTFTVPRDHYHTKVTLPGSAKPVIGPRRLGLRAGNSYQVYAVGTPGHYRLIVVKIHVGTH